MNYTLKLREKLKEALSAVLPIIGIVLMLCFSVAPISPSILLCFLLGAVLLITGMMFFTLGALEILFIEYNKGKLSKKERTR